MSRTLSKSAVAHATDFVPLQQVAVVGTVAPPSVNVSVAIAPRRARTGSPNATTTGEVRPTGAAIAAAGATVSTVHVRVAGLLGLFPGAVATTVNVCVPWARPV